jgi:hypothetical protein
LQAAGLFDEWRRFRADFVEKCFVPILYRQAAFEAFDGFSDFVKSVSCKTSKTFQAAVG